MKSWLFYHLGSSQNHYIAIKTCNFTWVLLNMNWSKDFNLTMNSVYYKEHDDGIASNPVVSLSSGSGPWWSGLVTQSGFEESVGLLKGSPVANCGEQLLPMAPKPLPRATDHAVVNGDMTRFNIFNGKVLSLISNLSSVCKSRFKKTETSFEAFSLRLTRRKPRGEPRRKPEAELKNKYKYYIPYKNSNTN
ncbi:putative nuclear transcription factor Y subunit A [Helianthus annuus]|nr:putative nuclear transcription factor Y subunit A [Helianthus annuus]